jgi:hypothetical protein
VATSSSCVEHPPLPGRVIVGLTIEFTGRGDFIQPSNLSIKLRKTLPALRSNEWLGRSPMLLIARTPQQNDA